MDGSGQMIDVDAQARRGRWWRDGPWRGGSLREWIGGGVAAMVDGSDGDRG